MKWRTRVEADARALFAEVRACSLGTVCHLRHLLEMRGEQEESAPWQTITMVKGAPATAQMPAPTCEMRLPRKVSADGHIDREVCVGGTRGGALI